MAIEGGGSVEGAEGAEAAIEARTQELGRALLDAARAYRPGPAERIEDWLLTHAVTDDRFRSRLLRYMDVLAALDYDTGGDEAKRLAREYFGEDAPGLPRGLRWVMRVARSEHLPAPLVGETARRSAEVFAKRFITPPSEDTVRGTIAYLAEHGRYPSFDLLGEAVLSEREAEAYVARYLELIERLSRDPAAGSRTAGEVSSLQLSIKLSSLTAHFSPVDPRGSVERVRGGLEQVALAAREAGIGLTVDAEQYELRDLTWEAFRVVFGRDGVLGDWGDAGLVVQGYLRDAHAHAHEVESWAATRGAPIQVRLVKGAYWDYEAISAAAKRWQAPVHVRKGATDAQFERLIEGLAGAPGIRLAVASHNARAHAFAQAVAASRGLGPEAIEHQTLYRTAEGTSRALADLGWVARDYVPVGELLSGMAYLVRRVLENSSQAGFLLQSRAGASEDELLRAPDARAHEDEPLIFEEAGFERAPVARWHDAAFRDAFERALAATRARWGERYALDGPLAGEGGAEWVEVHSPSHPSGEPVGVVERAGLEATDAALELVRGGQPSWAARTVEERAAVLCRAAALLEEREHEFAAWIVHEGGRDRADAFAEVEEAVDYLGYYAQHAERLWAESGDRIAPRGVVAVIPPWNFSLAIPCGMTSAALACGNAVILKPAEQTPLIARRLVDLLHEAGVPSDALVWLPGEGEVAGHALALDDRVAMIAFTGSRGVGTWLHEATSGAGAGGAAADSEPKALVAEMGGKNAAIVFPDADLDEAVEGVLRSAFGHANQKCSAVSRVIVAAPVFDAFASRLVEAARSLEVGAADEPSTRVNPIIDAEARERLEEAADRARREGEVLLDRFDEPSMDGAARNPLLAGRLIVRLPVGEAVESSTWRTELFGPILALTEFVDEAEAFHLANASAYGLTAGVYSRSPRTIERAARALEAGTIYVNRHTTGARVAIEPFGGMKFSGTGPKAGGLDYLWAYVERTDAPSDAEGGRGDLEGAGAPSDDAVLQLRAVDARWVVPLDERLAAVEGAAVRLGMRGDAMASQVFAATQAARRELAVPQPTLQVPGQHTELRYDVSRGRTLLLAASADAGWWVAASLLAGNGVALVASAGTAGVVETLHEAGVPRAVLASLDVTPAAAVALASRPEVELVATDGAPSLVRALRRAAGSTVEGQRQLRAVLSRLEGPQAGEAGFARRFAWPRVIAVRTLRHGADLALEPGDDE